MKAWMDDAECAQIGTEMFFPVQGENIRIGKRICASCPVVAECLQDALETMAVDDHGIRGGTTARERVQMRKSAA